MKIDEVKKVAVEAEAAVNAELAELQQKLQQLGDKGKWR